MLAQPIEDMDFSIVHGHHDILFSQVQTRDDALVGRNRLHNALASFAPCGLDQVLVAEVQVVRLR